jgi:hypothetical protein
MSILYDLRILSCLTTTSPKISLSRMSFPRLALCISWGRPGWYVVGALFTLTGLAARLAVRWAEAHRHVQTADGGP